jgi:hypothetical protein
VDAVHLVTNIHTRHELTVKATHAVAPLLYLSGSVAESVRCLGSGTMLDGAEIAIPCFES